MKTSHRIQEWLADRCSWVQYPNIRPADATTREASRAGIQFRTAMPVGKRIDLFLFSLLLLFAGLVALGATMLLFYVLIF